MNVLNVNQWKITDPIPTEETIDNNFIKENKEIDKDSLLNKYTYVNYNLTESINKLGIDETQIVINQIVQNHNPKTLVWTCQHILVNNLNFWQGKVFTPHATRRDNYYSIPHFPVNISKFVSIKDKTKLLSFRGSFETHPTRSLLKDTLTSHKENIINTGAWHFHNQNLKDNQSLYLDDLKSSKIILCPRGTGPSTIRLWEAIASGCIPLVISNDYKFPMEDIVGWDHICINIREEHIPVLNHYIKKFDDDRLLLMQTYGQEVFNKWFKPNKMHNILKYHLTK